MSATQTKRRLLIIDDDKFLCDLVAQFFRGEAVDVLTAHRGADGVHIASKTLVDVVLLDQKLPDVQGVDVCPALLKHNDQTKIIFITAYPSFENALEAIKQGAYDYLSKPFELEELKLTVERALKTLTLEHVEQIHAYRSSKESEEAILLGKESGLAEVWRMVGIAADSDVPVLITGKTGVGKNIVARCIHYNGPLGKRPFITVNCAAIPEQLIEGELFGHEKGAFTGAVAVRKGLFEMAESGTLFLDEIGALPFTLQSKLLGALDERKVRRLGGETARSVNVRIIAATNEEVEKAVAGGTFREDLYYRLNVFRIHIPPLKDRLQDVPELCRHFVRQIAPDSRISIPESELACLRGYQWPGNVRELKNVIERSIILRSGDTIRPSALLMQPLAAAPPENPIPIEDDDIVSLEEIEKNYIRRALSALSWNHTRTAKKLGVSRSTLNRKIKAYRIEKP
ncbi:hypothetical protein D3OALGA1CA_2260 [Olavius algarvensis associated proteobacterium Delta 3]|nr:hypothetical protein D3OALGA1CA_2260 [Olavius algarvensis associated proteobacterium Delta 3]CAB5165532.1 hypothetical protein D3OALGB2SA_5725 [Olavius algarvensis associated proteobacterium Delta 3]